MKNTGMMMQKTVVRFAKTGPAIYHSHHDIIRFWERAVKRADLPMRLTQGFNPRPRIVFPHALGLGIASRHEEVELELHAATDLDELRRRLEQAAGDTLPILGVENLPPIKKSRQLAASFYRVAGWNPEAARRLPAAAAALLDQREIVVRRGPPGDQRSVDIRPYIRKPRWDEDDGALLLELAHTPSGSARPDEIVRLLAAETETDPRDLTIEKTGMTLQ